MFERSTEPARQVLVLAQEEARALKHNHIGTEHILLGLLREEEGLAACVLACLDITVERVRAQVIETTGLGEEAVFGELPLTPGAQKIPGFALREALSLGHNRIGTEHILLGLVRADEGVATAVLLDAGADTKKIRDEVFRTLASPDVSDVYRPADATGAWGPAVDPGRWDVLVDGAGAPLQTLIGELEQHFDRCADAGDLLVMLASVPDGVGQRALEALGVHADALAGAVDEARGSGRRSLLLFAPELLTSIEQARAQKHAAIKAHQFVQAAETRKRERELLAAALETVKPHEEQFVAQLRARLGLKRA